MYTRWAPSKRSTVTTSLSKVHSISPSSPCTLIPCTIAPLPPRPCSTWPRSFTTPPAPPPSSSSPDDCSASTPGSKHRLSSPEMSLPSCDRAARPLVRPLAESPSSPHCEHTTCTSFTAHISLCLVSRGIRELSTAARSPFCYHGEQLGYSQQAHRASQGPVLSLETVRFATEFRRFQRPVASWLRGASPGTRVQTTP